MQVQIASYQDIVQAGSLNSHLYVSKGYAKYKGRVDKVVEEIESQIGRLSTYRVKYLASKVNGLMASTSVISKTVKSIENRGFLASLNREEKVQSALIIANTLMQMSSEDEKLALVKKRESLLKEIIEVDAALKELLKETNNISKDKQWDN